MPKLEKEKPINTICFTLRQRSQKSIEIASATAWDTCKDTLEKMTGPSIDSDLIDIHKHLEKRQHDAFCQSLFNLLKSEVTVEHDNWLVPLNVTRTTSRSVDKSFMHAFIDKFFGERLIQTIEVTSVEQGRIIISISDSVELVIKLIDIEDNDNTDNDNTGDDNINILRSSFTKTLRHCLLLSQSLLLKHFKNTGSIINRHSLVLKANIYDTNSSSSSSNKEDRKKSVIYNVLNVMVMLLERYRTNMILSKLAANISQRGSSSGGIMNFNLTVCRNDDASNSIHHKGYHYDITHSSFTARLSIDYLGLRVASIVPTITFSTTSSDRTCNYSIATPKELESFFENVMVGCDVRDLLLSFECYSIEPSVYISVHPIASTIFDIRSSSSSSTSSTSAIEGHNTVIRITISATEKALVLQILDDKLSKLVASLSSTSSLISLHGTTTATNLLKLPIDEHCSSTIKSIVQLLLT